LLMICAPCLPPHAPVSLPFPYTTLFRSCGSSGLHLRMCPLYSVSCVCFFLITPDTSPASEFHRTWSPTLNVLLMFPSPSKAAAISARPHIPSPWASPHRLGA